MLKILPARLFTSCLLLLVLLFMGCSTEEKKPEENVYNPVLQEAAFTQDLKQKYLIMMIAPASGVDAKKMQRIREIPNLSIEMPENAVEENIIFHANSDESRFLELKKALLRQESNLLLWSLRGGYGSARLMEALQKMPKPKTEKIVIGYSDITALHLFLSQRWGWKTIHGAVLTDLLLTNKDPQNFIKITELLTHLREKKSLQAEIPGLVPLNTLAKNVKTLTGNLTGGNLTIIQTSIGTRWQIQTKNKILFLEDDGGKGYQLDRTLNHLKQAGLFKDVRAIVFGDFKGSDEFLDLALQRFSEETPIPIFKTENFGHGTKNYPLIYNSKATIKGGKGAESFVLRME